jgi:hypothetical protein
MSNCLFCNSKSFAGTPFEVTLFNTCKHIQVNQLPTLDGLTKLIAMD